jgi:hypothetical protein
MGVVFNISGDRSNLEVHEDKVVIKPKGLMSAVTIKSEKSLPFSSIGAINLKEPGFIVQGILEFGSGGENTNFAGKLVAHAFDNTFVFGKGVAGDVLKAKNYIENRIQELRSSNSNVQIQQLSPADELRKFKQLLDDGIITQSEFDEKKKQFL